MARSHHRHKKQHHSITHHASSTKPGTKAAGVLCIFVGVFGLGIGYFATGSITATVIGAVLGGLVGYLVGHRIDQRGDK